jgi:hypothetical protein
MVNWNIERNLGKEDYVEVCSEDETEVICIGWEGCESQEGLEANGHVEGKAACGKILKFGFRNRNSEGRSV